MGSTYLARIASFYSGIAVKVVAGAGEEGVLAKDRATPADLQSSNRNGRNFSENYISQRHSTLRGCGSSACEVWLGFVPSEDDRTEIENFKAELEALRLRMIDACLHGYVCAAEAPRVIAVDRVSHGDPTLQQADRSSLKRAVQDEVASAVRLLAAAADGARRK